VRKILAEPAMLERLNSLGFVAAPMATAEFAAFQREEVRRWRELVDLTGIRLEG